ncbi:tyrosine recombinase XerC [uncultured Cellulomonas sp.]|uniref:site-specific integrase n=1 Tax=uncultured Cellulomonas sp. TaxID=189682 RepID=UPI002617C323|nr:tyrosine-type recombinase/integrase [uncultured Cellulomonas sp.]
MGARRSYGEGSLYWNESRQRWVGLVSLGYWPNGKRRVKWISGRTKTEVRAKLRDAQRVQDAGLAAERHAYTVREAVESWLDHGLVGRGDSTVANRRSLAITHVLPELGARRLSALTAAEVETWLAGRAEVLSTDTVKRLLSILRMSIRRAEARDLVGRNVALLCDVPRGQVGRPSKSLTLQQAKRVITASERSPMHAYVVVSLLTGARTEELRALRWEHVDLEGRPPDVPPTVELWRSVRSDGDTKTRRSRRTIELPVRAVVALRTHRELQETWRREAGERWREHGLVFASRTGTPLDAANVRRGFRAVVAAAGLPAEDWTPRELRHSFVSVMSSSGVPIEDIAHLVGHASTKVTETVYRKELRPVLTRGARAMDDIFGSDGGHTDD